MRWGIYGECRVIRYKEKSTRWGKYGESRVIRYKEKSLRWGKMLRFMHGEKWDCNLGMGKKQAIKVLLGGNVRQSNLRRDADRLTLILTLSLLPPALKLYAFHSWASFNLKKKVPLTVNHYRFTLILTLSLLATSFKTLCFS